MLRIRLARTGKKKAATFRVVVTEQSWKRRFIEIVGHFDPRSRPAGITLNRERIDYWLSRGAQPSETVQSMLKTTG